MIPRKTSEGPRDAEFHTEFVYRDRESKAEYVARKYASILKGRVLDVGADECHLEHHLSPEADYLGVDIGTGADIQLDLESGELPFHDDSFDVVLCLDVLEHLDHTHAVFDELCRVARDHLVISLPNPLAELWRRMRFGPYAHDRLLKFYGLPPERPADRHKWFFSASEAERFLSERGQANGWDILHLDHTGKYSVGGRWARWLLRRVVHPSFDLDDLRKGTLWAVLTPAGSDAAGSGTKLDPP